MPVLASLMLGQFTALVAFLGLYVTRKVAFALASVAAMTALTLGLFVIMRSTMAGLDTYATGLSAFCLMVLQISVPPAAPFCISSYLTMWTACTVYAWQRDLLNVVVKA